MITLLVLGLFISGAVAVTVIFMTKRKAPYPVFTAAFLFLAMQGSYLCLVIFDNAPDSEAWMFLALSYIPLSSILLLLVTVLSIATAAKANSRQKMLTAFTAIPIHALCSYAILSLWGHLFQFPL